MPEAESPLPINIAVDRRKPVADQVYDASMLIVTVRLPPGTSISDTDVQASALSRTPVRSAIVRLAEEGLIHVYPQQGSFVAPIRFDEVRDCHFVRKHLELAILAEAAMRRLRR